MSTLFIAIVLLVAFGSLLALAEASISRMTPVRALALREQGRRNGGSLVQIENDPARYLNAIYLAVMFAQNGSATLVAILAATYFDDVGITIISVIFTLVYFVVVEAMSKTFAILHSDSVALGLAPLVRVLGLVLSLPTRGLIGLANVLLPGKGLKQGPFVSEEEIRSMADVGHKEGVIDDHEKQMIHSVFQFGERTVRDVMVPRPDMVAIDLASPVHAAAELIVHCGFTRIPAYRGDLDKVEGVLHAKDILNALHQGHGETPVGDLVRTADFVPESKRLVELLNEMRLKKFHLAIVSDEFGSVAGVVTLEDVLEELVGQIGDEYDQELPDIVELGAGRYRINATLPISELNERLGTELPQEQWNTVGGLMFHLLGNIPSEGAAAEMDGFQFTAERVQGRRIVTVLVAPATPAANRARE